MFLLDIDLQDEVCLDAKFCSGRARQGDGKQCFFKDGLRLCPFSGNRFVNTKAELAG